MAVALRYEILARSLLLPPAGLGVSHWRRIRKALVADGVGGEIEETVTDLLR